MSEYVEYKSLVRSLTGLLGLSCIDHWDTEWLHQGVLEVLRFLNQRLLENEAPDIYGNMKNLGSIIDEVNHSLLEGEGLEAFFPETEVDTEPLQVAWTNVTTSVWGSIKCNYASVLWDLEHQGCGCRCGCGDTENDDEDSLYGKLTGNGARFSSGCGCRKGGSSGN